MQAVFQRYFMDNFNQFPLRNSSRGVLALPLSWGVRVYDDNTTQERNCFQRDRDRIIHSNVFRRLKHKTQVFVAPKSDHFRTRLTHSLEVAQIARSLARNLGCDEDLTEAIALAHDIGHPPFGHVGEFALRLALKNYGGFDHNHQTLRNLMVVEDRYIDHKGLNLTAATLLGLVQHHGKIGEDEIIAPCAEVIFDKLGFDKKLSPSLEAQIAAEADDIAYNGHDIDDGFNSSVLEWDNIMSQEWLNSEIMAIKAEYPHKFAEIPPKKIISLCVRRMISQMIHDIYQQTYENIRLNAIKSPQDIVHFAQNIVHHSPLMQTKIKSLKKFLYDNLYLSEKLASERKKSHDCVVFLANYYLESPEFVANFPNINDRALAVRDYVSGMTDLFALNLIEKLQ